MRRDPRAIPWYGTPRGRWIGEVEWALLHAALELRPGDSLLDVGCGTGPFTRRAAAEGAQVVGLDIDERALEFARRHTTESVRFLHGDATCLPFEDRSFDNVMSATALCFVPQWQKAVAEIVRVSRRRFALGGSASDRARAALDAAYGAFMTVAGSVRHS